MKILSHIAILTLLFTGQSLFTMGGAGIKPIKDVDGFKEMQNLLRREAISLVTTTPAFKDVHAFTILQQSFTNYYMPIHNYLSKLDSINTTIMPEFCDILSELSATISLVSNNLDIITKHYNELTPTTNDPIVSLKLSIKTLQTDITNIATKFHFKSEAPHTTSILVGGTSMHITGNHRYNYTPASTVTKSSTIKGSSGLIINTATFAGALPVLKDALDKLFTANGPAVLAQFQNLANIYNKFAPALDQLHFIAPNEVTEFCGALTTYKNYRDLLANKMTDIINRDKIDEHTLRANLSSLITQWDNNITDVVKTLKLKPQDSLLHIEIGLHTYTIPSKSYNK